MDKDTINKKNFFSEWLEKLQQESWQLELLISGLALFGIYASEELILSLEYYHQVNSVDSAWGYMTTFITLLWASRMIFLVNLLFHIVIRGFWIGAIGLRYVSGDIDFDNLNYSEKFTQFYKKKIGSYDEYIEKLEKFSSILFSFTFLLFFMLLSFFAYNVFFILCMEALNGIFDLEGDPPIVVVISIVIYYGLGFLVFIDFFTLGVFKKIKDKNISTIYLWIYRFFSAVSLSFFFRPLLLNFIDNKYTRRLFFMAIPYALILLVLSGFYFERYDYFPTFDLGNSYQSQISEASINYVDYDDLRKEHYETLAAVGRRVERRKISRASINHYEYDHNNLSIFIEYREADNDLLDSLGVSIDPFRVGGIRHSLFNENTKDKGMEKLTDQQVIEIRQINKMMRKDEQTQEDSLLIKRYGDLDGDLNELKKSIQDHYRSERRDYMENKIISIRDELKNFANVTIDDDININEDLACKFFIHPNMLEKGLLCHYNIDTLAYGDHLLRVTKNNRVRKIPFRKIKQNQ